jgi:hypothetical protein
MSLTCASKFRVSSILVLLSASSEKLGSSQVDRECLKRMNGCYLGRVTASNDSDLLKGSPCLYNHSFLDSLEKSCVEIDPLSACHKVED